MSEFEQFVTELIQTGRYKNSAEVLHAAKEALLREQRREAKTVALREAIEAGFASGVAEGDVFARVRKRAGLPVRARAWWELSATPCWQGPISTG
jgi:putative addiction module CopG family antidote